MGVDVARDEGYVTPDALDSRQGRGADGLKVVDVVGDRGRLRTGELRLLFTQRAVNETPVTAGTYLARNMKIQPIVGR